MTSSRADAGPPHLVLVHGDEPLLVDRALARAVRAARRAYPGLERREAPAVGLGVGGFNDLVAPSLFAEPRIVIVRGAQDAAKDLAAAITAYLAAPAPEVVLAVHHSGSAKNKALVDALTRAGAAVARCPKITHDSDRLEFLRRELKAAGATASQEAVVALLEGVGNDLAELASAANQLAADAEGMVDAAAVRRYHRGRAAVTGYTVADHAVTGNIAGALEALRWARAVGVAHVLIADAIADGVRTIAKVAGAGAGSGAQLAPKLGIAPWKINRARGEVRHWTAPGLAAALEAVTRLNGEVKGGAQDADYALERAVLAIGHARWTRE